MNVLSLFDGMSCGQIALQQLGIKADNYYASEIDKYCIQITQKNFPNTIQIGDVCDVKGADLPKIDLIMGGSPCQGFSFAGKQLAFDDPRSKLFFEFVRLVKECQPKYFLLENVRMKKEFLAIISEHLGVEPVCINSALVSAQNRVRYYWTNIPGIEQPEDRNMVLKDILDNKDIDLGQFNTFDPTLKTTVISLMRSAAPQGYIDQMDKLASGLPIENADSYLDLFAILSNDPTKTGLFINRFGDALDQKTIELLNDANSIRTTIGGNANEIITTLVERQNDPKSSVQMDLVLGDKTPTEYATDYFGGDQIIGTELSASVEYLARSGKSKKQINARLETLKDQHYPKSTYIVDPRFPVGSIKRSRYALEKQFPDEEERKAFIAAVESNLPSDYSLDPNLSQLPEQFVSPEERRAEQKKVYLAPDESTAGVLYFSYFVDENEELRPLIFEKDGISMWPTFSKKDISDYYKKKEAENKAELDALEQKQSKGFALQKKIRDMDPSISAFTRGLGAGGL